MRRWTRVISTVAGTAVILANVFGQTPSRPAPAGPAPLWALIEAGRLTYEGEINRRTIDLGHLIVFTTKAGWIMAVDPERKSLVWQYHARALILRPPAAGESRVAAVDSENTIYCLASDGAMVWEFQSRDAIACDPVIFSRGVVVAFESGAIAVLSLERPEEVWRINFDNGAARSMAVWNDRIVVADGEGKLRVLAANGSAGPPIDAGAPVSGPLTVEDNRLYAGREDGVLFCSDLIRRYIRWTRRTGGTLFAPPFLEGRSIYAATANGVLYALSKNSGEMEWWRPLNSRGAFTPAFWQGKIVASSMSPVLVSFDPKSGEVTGEFRRAGDWSSDPRPLDGALLIHAYDRQSGQGTLVFLQPPPSAPAKTNKGA